MEILKCYFFALEFGPTTNTLQWVTNIAGQYPDHDVYVVTHNYLMPDGTRNSAELGDPYTPASYGLTDGADGVGIWENLKTIKNLRMIAGGHQLQLDGDPLYEAHSVALGTQGNWVNQIFINYQQFAGVATIALLNINPITGEIKERTYNVEPATYVDNLGGNYTIPFSMSGDAPVESYTAGTGINFSTPDAKGIVTISSDASASGNVSSVGLNDDLLLYWPFSETSGTTTTDATTNAFTGTLTSSTMITNGVLGRGLNFISASSQKVTASSTATVSGLTNLTLSVWFKTTDNISGSVDLIAKTAGSTNGEFQLALSGNSNILFTIINASSSRVDMTPTSSSYNDGLWHLAAATYDGATMKTWLDGQCLGSSAQTGIIKSYATALVIGAYASGQYFNGNLDEVKIWSRALGTNEISAIWQAGGRGSVTNTTTTTTELSSTEFGINDDLYLHWAFNGTSNFVMSVSTNQIGGYFSGSAARTNDGIFGNGIVLSASGSSQVIASNNAVAQALSNITLSAWIKTTNALSSDYTIMAKHQGGTSGEFLFSLQSGGSNVNFSIINGTPSRVNLSPAASFPLNDGNWHFVVGTYNGATMAVFVDGICFGTASQTGGLQTNATPFRVGAYNSGNFFNGQIDDVEVWSRGLRTNEVVSLWLAGGFGISSNVVYSSGGATNTLVFRGGILQNIK